MNSVSFVARAACMMHAECQGSQLSARQRQGASEPMISLNRELASMDDHGAHWKGDTAVLG